MLLHPDAKAPARSKDRAMGHDICCVAGVKFLQTPETWSDEQRRDWRAMEARGYVVIHPGQSFLFRTGFAQAIQEGYACMLWDRSGLGAMKLVGRLAGVIDEDFRGEWFVRLVNHSPVAVTIRVGEKIVQGVYQERIVADCQIVTELDVTERGTAGFGSTDKPVQ